MKLKSSFLLFVLCALWPQISGEPFFTSRFAVPWLLRPIAVHQNRINSTNNIIASASEYLGKFGWVEPADWDAVSPRSDETVVEGQSWSTFEARRPVIDRERRLNKTALPTGSLSARDFAAALKSFQQANGLRATGILDARTMSIMSQLRCGVPDQTMDANKSVEYQQTIASRQAIGISPKRNIASVRNLFLSASHRRQRRGVASEEPLNSAFHLFANNHREPIKRSRSDLAEVIEIAEDEPEDDSRLKNVEEILETLRKETSPWDGESSETSFVSRIANEAVDMRRIKRSNSFRDFHGRGAWGMAFNKESITWRLVREWPTINNQHLSRAEIWFTLKLAFRIWSETLPRNFQEDNHSLISNVDILIGFGTKRHNRCPVQFKSGLLTREFAHAWALPKAEIHFNDAQTFVPANYLSTPASRNQQGRTSLRPISFLKVAIHEIGHALGLFHNENRVSVMNPYYQPFQEQNIVELSVHDRENIKKIYGKCDVRFDAVFDWVRQTRNANGAITWKFNTYFFRHSWYWLYENGAQRPRYGDPRYTATNWRGVLTRSDQSIDGVAHVRKWNNLEGPTFFFKGDLYIEYDSTNSRVKTENSAGQTYPRRIADDFPGVPYPIDTVMFKYDEEILYFFKDSKVYRFRWSTKTLLDSALISTAFPGWGGATPLPHNIDVAYYSYTNQAYYFIKGEYYWKLADERERQQNTRVRIPYNAVGPRQKVTSKWKYLCDVGPSELILNLPT